MNIGIEAVPVVIVTILTIIFHIKYGEKTLSYGPTILTTTGIFATFLGIAIGLWHFDERNIEQSVPALLGGLKTAFWASVFGVGGALTIKFRHYFIGLKNDVPGSGADGEVRIEDIVSVLRKIQDALVGTDDSTLVSQLKLSRQDTNDRLDALRKAQTDALQKLTEMSSKTLVEALRDVIKDFNNKITEQFGENFKHLNESVGKLLVWQEQYKNHIEALVSKHENIATTMQTASDSYMQLVSKADVFGKIAGNLSSTLDKLENQKLQLASMLDSLGQLLISASGSLPEIEKKIIEIATQLSSALEQGQKEINKSQSENAILIKTTLDAVGRDLANSNQEFNKHVGDLTDKTHKQVAALDAALEVELKKSLDSLGNQLAALSEKFVSDYSPLTEKLQELVRSSR